MPSDGRSRAQKTRRESQPDHRQDVKGFFQPVRPPKKANRDSDTKPNTPQISACEKCGLGQSEERSTSNRRARWKRATHAAEPSRIPSPGIRGSAPHRDTIPYCRRNFTFACNYIRETNRGFGRCHRTEAWSKSPASWARAAGIFRTLRARCIGRSARSLHAAGVRGRRGAEWFARRR